MGPTRTDRLDPAQISLGRFGRGPGTKHSAPSPDAPPKALKAILFSIHISTGTSRTMANLSTMWCRLSRRALAVDSGSRLHPVMIADLRLERCENSLQIESVGDWTLVSRRCYTPRLRGWSAPVETALGLMTPAA
jgi:hypothetical protein